MDDGVDDLRPAIRYLLPEDMREELSKDFGPVVPDDQLEATLAGTDCIIAVGDVVSLDLKERDIEPRVFICDFKTHRDNVDPRFKQELGGWGDKEVKVLNPASIITRKAWSAIRAAIQDEGRMTRIVVNGEEDLLGIPAFLEAPVGAKVVYGSPGKGAVVVTVTETFQQKVRALVGRFDEE